jgi:hypothetical protein
MSSKEDILEQIVEEYLLHRGYFVQHNIKFRPDPNHQDFVKNQDSNHSDIDVLGFHPLKTGPDRVVIVSCKSWQGGFNPRSEVTAIINKKKLAGRERWKSFRELVSPKWSGAFLTAVEEATGTREFVYITAVTRLDGDKNVWEQNQDFRNAINGNSIKILELKEMLDTVSPNLSTTMANTSIGRFLQLIKAANLQIVGEATARI